MADVYIQGIDMVRFGRYPDIAFPKLGGEAALLALDDAAQLGEGDVRVAPEADHIDALDIHIGHG